MTDVTEEHRFPCTTCGSDLRFAPDSAVMQCNHCGATQNIATSAEPIRELDFNKAIKNQLPDLDMEERQTVSCESCGAHVTFEANSHATECPFCATPVVTDTGTTRQIKPKALLAFALAERDARKKMTDWLGRLWFAPNGLKDYARKGRKMQGIYVPYWTYDADTKSKYTGERGTVYYVTEQVTVMVDGKQKTEARQVPKIRWTRTRGRLARVFDDVLVLGSTSLPKHYTDALAPWNLSKIAPYRPEYLAGFHAESYTVSLEDGYKEACTYMDREIEADVRSDIGGDEQRINTVDTDVSGLTFKHILLPVWLAAYKYRGKTYRFVVNGRSGEVQGERPYSAAKIAFAVALTILTIAVIGYFSSQG